MIGTMQEIRTLIFAVAVVPFFVACGDASVEDAILDAGAPDSGATGDGGPQPISGQPTVYYVVRHAERDPGDDPPINDEGAIRAERLADALERAGIDEIITTSFIRGQQTGEPLSNRMDVPMTVAPLERVSWPTLATNVAEWQLEREVDGATYLMIGHSGGYNTTLLEALGAPSSGTLAERYQDLVILIREPDGAVKLSMLQYGGESSLDP